jgi:peptide chain release factor 1
MRLSDARLDQVLDRFAAVEAGLAHASTGPEIARLSRERAELAPVVEAIEALRRARADKAGAEAMLEEADAELKALAREEIAAAEEALPALEHALQLLLLPRDKDDAASVVLEVRAGTGGDEAALFAGDLFAMYERYAAARGWRVEVDSVSEGEMGGYKEIIASISGEGVFGRLKFESGVHRVQRVPATESQGRIHTSAATVAVLPEPEDVDIVIEDKDIRIDTMRASGAGGQHVNKTDSAVRITHLPTGIVVTSSEKSQHQNRAKAMKVLRARLYEQSRAAADAARAAERKGQVGSGDRSERIRTYNFPQGRVSDHRINLTLYTLSDVVAGGLDPLIEALLADDQSKKLAALDEG